MSYATEEMEEKAPGMDLSIPMTIAELIAARGQIIEAWHETNRAIDSIDAAFARIHDKDFRLVDSDRRGGWNANRQDKVEIKRMTEALDYSLFVFALAKLNITNAMTETAKDAFLAKVKEAKTVFDETQLTGLAQNAHKLFRDSSLNTVREVFRLCIGTSYHSGAARLEKKRDNLQKVEKVFRVGWNDLGFDSDGSIMRKHCDHLFSGFRFDDLLTACRLIDGEGVPDYSNNMHALCHAVPARQPWVDTGYFIATKFHNGNVKVKWNEDKIHVLERLNAIGSGRENAMPDTMRKRYKSEHFRDGGMPKAETYFAPDADMVPSDDKDFAFYPTPEPVAARMVELAEYDLSDIACEAIDTLEPSAGDGGIVSAIPCGSVHMVEFNHHRCQKLRAKFAIDPYEADFLKWNPGRQFERVLMNAPFNDRIEAVHTVKAFSHLKPGGILVGIIPDGWFTREDTKSVVFREFLTRHQHKEPETLPAGTFGRTRVVTRIITLRKPL